ncbi:cell division protein ZapE [Aliiglaciecola sp. 3_MG-2023]|uniref:cell division protein ZapE n=1 Tax=Aliiglaciecola sp. 3_MG-2023 TaxID=3062644 RepID=UPI0026E210B4|nr:cell division protein ZapE [Aliiglaciecola sp. 3_MG-2023]MDO6695510.1 cell division protein ZapE [Aliiglaciecola sp. 3_MG-2023]
MPDGTTLKLAKHSPRSRYQSLLGSSLVEDPAQIQAVDALHNLFERLPTYRDSQGLKPKGIYLWGDVGRGKTFLMDLFYDCLPSEGKLRLHFHRFMARIHQALKEHEGQQDPLVKVAQDLANEYHILCFDEFFVSDIGDAMILAGLFTSLFELGVLLVATSNIPIDRLYENGLARHKFLPCIALLQQQTQSIHLAGEQDHRLRSGPSLKDIANFASKSHNIGMNSDMNFSAIFDQLTELVSNSEINQTSITICHRQIPVVRAIETVTNSVAWFDFHALCEGPRSQLDYMEIASRFNTVMISQVPQLGGKVRGWIKARGTEDGIGDNQAASTGERVVSYAVKDDMARRFISLIDEFYDQDVKIYLSTNVPLTELYLEGALKFEFRRTYSRLMEMSRG